MRIKHTPLDILKESLANTPEDELRRGAVINGLADFVLEQAKKRKCPERNEANPFELFYTRIKFDTNHTLAYCIPPALRIPLASYKLGKTRLYMPYVDTSYSPYIANSVTIHLNMDTAMPKIRGITVPFISRQCFLSYEDLDATNTLGSAISRTISKAALQRHDIITVPRL